MNFDFDQAQRFGQLWLDFLSKSTMVASAVQPGAAPNEAARQMRSAVFSVMAEQAEQFMRSPEFLASMKQSMDASLQLQKQWQEFLTSVRHQTQGVAVQDVDAVMNLTRHLETRVLDRIEQMEGAMTETNRRLARLERLLQSLVGRDDSPAEAAKSSPNGTGA